MHVSLDRDGGWWLRFLGPRVWVAAGRRGIAVPDGSWWWMN